MHTQIGLESDWPNILAGAQARAGQLLARTPQEQAERGYFHTLNEICQQPATWQDTANRLLARRPELQSWLEGIKSVVLTGSGSSEYAADCVRLLLQNELAITTEVVGGGALLTHAERAIPPQRPGLMISLARSGDSPESVGALSLMLEVQPAIRHLIITCNAKGSLAHTYRHDDRVKVVALDERTHDRSLVMTSSFTNLALAARAIGLLNKPDQYRAISQKLARMGQSLLQTSFDTLARVGESGFHRAVFLGSGTRFGAARECALKMLEMTGGNVATLCETYLGLRHGPMSYVHTDTLLVCFLSSEPQLRAYESDLIDELGRKRLGAAKLIIGEHIPSSLIRPGDAVVELQGQTDLGDDNAAILCVVAGQVLALFRCMSEGLKPDSPSADGVINRVVERFTLHRSGRG